VKNFCILLSDLQGAASEGSQVQLLRGFLQGLTPAERGTVTGVLSGTLPSKLWTAPKLKALFLSRAGLPEWLWERCLKEGADVAECLARCWPREGKGLEGSLSDFLEHDWAALADPEKVIACWEACRSPERILVNRMLLGRLPINLPQDLVTRALQDPDADGSDLSREAEVELMYAHFPDFSFGQEQAGSLQLFARVRVEDPTHLKVLLDYMDRNLLEKKGPVVLVKRGLRGQIAYQRKIPSSRHKSGFKIEGAVLVKLFPPGEFWGI
jgi:hypothetical protein